MVLLVVFVVIVRHTLFVLCIINAVRKQFFIYHIIVCSDYFSNTGTECVNNYCIIIERMDQQSRSPPFAWFSLCYTLNTFVNIVLDAEWRSGVSALCISRVKSGT